MGLKMLVSILSLASTLIGAQAKYSMEKPILTKINGYSQSNLIQFNISLNDPLCENQLLNYAINLEKLKKRKTECNQASFSLWKNKHSRWHKTKELQNQKCNTTETFNGLHSSFNYCLVVFYTLAGNRSKNAFLQFTTKKSDRPQKTRVKAVNLKPMISWRPRKEWMKRNVSYELEARDTSLGSTKASWVSRDCKVENFTQGLRCFPPLPYIFCARFRLRAVIQMENSPPLENCDCTTCHCSSYANTDKFCVTEKSTFSQPEITISGVQSTSLDVNIRLPKDTSITCQFPNTNFNVYVKDISESTDPKICDTLAPKVENGFDQDKDDTASPTNQSNCNGDRAIQSFDFQHLKPSTKYCVFGLYKVNDVTVIMPTSGIDYLQVTTKRDNVTIIVSAGIAVAIALTAAVFFIAYKLNDFYENFKSFVYGDIPEFIKKSISDDPNFQDINGNENCDTYRSYEDDRKPEVVDKLEVSLTVGSLFTRTEDTTTTEIHPPFNKPSFESEAQPYIPKPTPGESPTSTPCAAQNSGECFISDEDPPLVHFRKGSVPPSISQADNEALPEIPVTASSHQTESSSSENLSDSSVPRDEPTLDPKRRSCDSDNTPNYSVLANSDSTETELVIMNRAVSCQMINAKLDRNVEMNVNENLPLLKDPDFTIGKFVPFQRPELGLTGDCEPGSYIFK